MGIIDLARGGSGAIERDVVAVARVAQADFLADLRPPPAEHPSGLSEHMPTDPTPGTSARPIVLGGAPGGIKRLLPASRIRATESR